MTTPRQIAANRANAKRSTGPRTEHGKARSRMNAWKHGVTAENIVIFVEKADDFDGLRAELWEEWKPQPGLESCHVDYLATQCWRLRRVPLYEAAAIDTCCMGLAQSFADNARLAALHGAPTVEAVEEDIEPGQYLGKVIVHDADILGKLARHEATLMAGIRKTVQMLLLLQGRRATTGRMIEAGTRAIDAPPQQKEITRFRLSN
jgi:hypothetical protein